MKTQDEITNILLDPSRKIKAENSVGVSCLLLLLPHCVHHSTTELTLMFMYKRYVKLYFVRNVIENIQVTARKKKQQMYISYAFYFLFHFPLCIIPVYLCTDIFYRLDLLSLFRYKIVTDKRQPSLSEKKTLIIPNRSQNYSPCTINTL